MVPEFLGMREIVYDEEAALDEFLGFGLSLYAFLGSVHDVEDGWFRECGVHELDGCWVVRFPLSEFVPCIVCDGLEGRVQFCGAAKYVDSFETSSVVVEDHGGYSDRFP